MFKEYSIYDLDAIVFELKNQKSAIINTDTVPGIISLEEKNIYFIKKRSRGKKIIKFVKDYSLIPYLTKIEMLFLEKFWPGPVTIVKNNISYRMPNDDFLLVLLSILGSFYCSSANISGEEVINDVDEANNVFPESLYYDLFLIKTKPNASKKASTIINLDTWKILREGENIEEIKEYLLNNIFNRNN